MSGAWIVKPLSQWPVTFKAPALVAIFMVAISLLISDRVMTRLAETQERHLRELSDTYLDGLSSAIQPFVLAEDVWEVFDSLDRAQSLYAGLNAVETVVLNPSNRVIAASHPAKFPTGSDFPRLMIEKLDHIPIQLDPHSGKGFALRNIVVQGRKIGSIYTEVDGSQLLAERDNVRRTLLLTNIGLTILLTALGYFAVRRMLSPVKTLGNHLSQSVTGPVTAIPDSLLGSPQSEFGTLFRRYNAMVSAIDEREHLAKRLAEEEKLSSLGRLASGMAHEINNPLGGLLNTLDTLSRYADRPAVRANSIRILERGLRDIQRIVQAALLTYQGEDHFVQRDDLEDLKLLIRPQLERRSVHLDWANGIDVNLNIPAAALRQAVLNLLLNAIEAAEGGGRVKFSAKAGEESLNIEISDSGRGMPSKFKTYLEQGSAAAPLEAGSGLGLWMVRRFMDDVRGTITVASPPEGGTIIILAIPLIQHELQDVA